MAYERYAVLRVPFPFTDRTAANNRPALVLSDAARFNTPAGLPAPSMVRFKLFTLDHRLVRGVLGQLAPADRDRVSNALAEVLGRTS